MSAQSFDGNRSDDGFTLPELLISIVMMGIIAIVLGGVFTVFLRSTPTTEARAQDARSVLGLVTWLPQDVDSTPSDGFDVDPSTDSGCNVDPGINLLRMEWVEKIGSVTTTFISNYRHVSDVDAARLVRITCSGVGSPPFANGSEQNLTSDLPLLPGGWTPTNAPAAVKIIRTPAAVDPTTPVELVTMELTTFDGDVVRTDSASKNPADTLPTTTLPSWIPPTPSTIPYVNSPPETTDLMFDAFPGPTTTTVNLIVSDVDGHPLVVTLDSVPSGWVVTLVGLEMVITPDPADLGETRTIEYTVDDLQGGVVEGKVVVKVVTSPATTSTTIVTTTTTTTTTLPPPCAVTSAALTPNTMKNVNAEGGSGAVNVGILFKKVVITASTNGYCNGVQIQYVSGGVNTPGFLNLLQVGPTSWSEELPGRGDGSSETWSDGAHQISFHDASGGPYLSRTLTIE